MTKTKTLSMLVLSIAFLASVASVKAYAPVYPDDSPETVQSINDFNSQQTQSSKEKYKDRVLGTNDQTKTPEERAAYQREMQATKQQRLDAMKADSAAKSDANREAMVENRCELVEAKIQNRLNNYEEKRDRYVSRYNQISDRLTSLLDKLDDRGCDSTAVRTNLVKLDELIAEFGTAYREMAADLEGTQRLACGESEGEFATAIRQAKAHVPTIHAKSQAIHTFISQTLSPQIRTLAASCEEVSE